MALCLRVAHVPGELVRSSDAFGNYQLSNTDRLADDRSSTWRRSVAAMVATTFALLLAGNGNYLRYNWLADQKS